jgi:hypothetical protein
MAAPLYRIMPDSDWRNRTKSEWSYIVRNLRANRMNPLAHIDINTQRQLPYYYVDAYFRTQPELNLSECRRIAQIACYFASPLMTILNPDMPQQARLHSKYSTHRHQVIKEIEHEIHSFSQLPAFFHRRYYYDQPFRFYFRRHEVEWPHYLFQSFAKDGDDIIGQLDTIVALFEASLSWPGGGLGGLTRWPSTLPGLLRFLYSRGTETHSLKDGKGNTKKLIRTPFTTSLPNRLKPPSTIPFDVYDTIYSLDPKDWAYSEED